MRDPQYQQIDLAELKSEDIEGLLGELIGLRDDITEIRQRIVARSAGNPFFAEELVRSLADNHVLVGSLGDYRRGVALSMDALPGTVQAVIGARIDLLPQPDRELLQIGAIVGKEFQQDILRSIADRAPEGFEASLDRLCASGLLQKHGGLDARGYAFRHPLVQEVAYSSQLKTRRGALHAAVARAIERFYPDRLDEQAALLAYHFEEAGESARAARFAARAARWLGWRSPAQAIGHWRKVRALVAGLPRDPEIDELRIAASSQIAWLGWREGMTAEEAMPLIQEALVWAREGDGSMIPMLLLTEGEGWPRRAVKEADAIYVRAGATGAVR